MTKALAFLLLAAVPRQDESDRWVEMLVRTLRDQLKLGEEQTKQVREMIQQSEKERREKIRAVLTDEQKKTFDEFVKSGPGGGGRDNRGGRQWMSGFGIEQLKEQLGLSDEQAGKIKEILDKFGDDMRKRFEGGGRDFNWREELPKLLEELGNKIKEHLTPEQKENFDKIVQERMRAFGGGDGPRRRPPVEERAKRTVEPLKIADEKERGVILDLVTKTLKARDAVEDYEREYRDKVRELQRSDLGEEALESRLNELREERKKRDKELSNARKELAEVVTFKQELALIEIGILK